jgi:chromosome segregation protein
MPGLIAIQRQRKELAAELEGVDEGIHSLENNVRAIQERLEISNRELVRVNEVRESKNKDRMMVQMEIDQLEKEIGREQRTIEMLAQELAQAVNEKEAVQARSDEFTQQLQQETSKREECERHFQEGEEQLARVKTEQGRLQVLVQDSRIQIAECKERDRALLAEMDRLNQQIETVQRAITDSRAQIAQKHQEITDTESVCTTLEAQQLEMLHGRDQQRAIIEERERQKETVFQEITNQETALLAARAELDRIREERTNCEIEKTRVETQMEDLLARCQEEMGISLEALELPESELRELGEEDLRNKLAETEIRIDRLGSINELALEEYVQMEERHRFLKTQYEDLKLSIETLLETIQRIDQTSLQRFREAFDAVQTNFLDYFQRLFNGGKCEMVMTDPENPNESGIDIHVQPPGKRLQNMMQLSGGEKALSGIAFLMSLFRYHASPFCVMDEVDAPLDESNVGRFVSLISEMKKQVQFIVVTHNKRTMEAADQLYGVTMGEPGVSSILSAKFEEAANYAS